MIWQFLAGVGIVWFWPLLFYITTRRSNVAYTNRTIRIAFDGTDEKYPNLGNDIWVVIQNPMLMPPSLLRPKTDVALDADGKPVDPDAAIEATYGVMTNLIVDWNVYDPTDPSDDPVPFAIPATLEHLNKLPMAIVTAISELIGTSLNPR